MNGMRSDWPMIIPYGTMGVAPTLAEKIRCGGMPDIGSPGAPVATVNASDVSTLRMHGLVHPFTRPPTAVDLRHADTQLAFLESHLVHLCGPFARLQQNFIRWYFAAIRKEIVTNEERIAEKTGALAGLIEPMHWCFSAPMPLPRAHLPVARDNVAWVKVDCGFYIGECMLAIVSDDLARSTKSRARDLARLQESGTTLIHLESGWLQEAGQGELKQRFGNNFAAFWDATPLPISPFTGRGIERPQPQTVSIHA